MLINLRNITDGPTLDRLMNDYASAVWAQLTVDAPPSRFDFSYLQSIHREMFGRLFKWAGEVRDVLTIAGETGIVYARPQFLGQGIDDMFAALDADDYLQDVEDADVFADRLAAHWGYLSTLHPFRDGNTRSQSLFISNLARAAGHSIDWSAIDVEALRQARLRAVQGDEGDLANILRASVTGGSPSGTLPVFRVDVSNSAGVAAPASLAGRCGRPRSNGRGPCQRRVGDHGCPYHG